MPIINPDGSVDVCPDSKEAWEARAQAKKADCGGESVYHCLPDSEGRKWEKCVQKSLVSEGNCLIFTGDDGFLDWKPCNTSENPFCPNTSFVSNEVYKYPWCFGNNTPGVQLSQDEDNGGLHNPVTWLIIAVVITILLIIGGIILLCVWRKRQNKTLYLDKVEELTPFLRGKKVVDAARKQKVIETMTALLSKDIQSIVVTGVIGNAVTLTSRFVLQKYAKRTKWSTREYFYTDVPADVEEKTIMLVYGWFGLWNDDLCSQKEAQNACKTLRGILDKKKSKVKVIIGITTEVYNKYVTELHTSGGLFADIIHLDERNTLPEYAEYFEKVKRSCKERGCPCKTLTTEPLYKGKDDFLGMPLKINIIANHHDHDLINDYKSCGDILKVMTKLITDLEEKDNYVYEWITYICLKGCYSPSEPIDDDMVRDIGCKISHSDEFDITKLERFFRGEISNQENNISGSETRYVFWHPFIYICAFHSLHKKSESVIMKHCNFDAIFQLVRPKDWKTSYIEVQAVDDCSVDQLKKRLGEGKNLHFKKKFGNHPLIKEPTAAQ